jgi:hypothetical protein
VTAKQIAVKKYVVKLSDEERERLNAMISSGKYAARQLTKARRIVDRGCECERRYRTNTSHGEQVAGHFVCRSLRNRRRGAGATGSTDKLDRFITGYMPRDGNLALFDPPDGMYPQSPFTICEGQDR